MFDLHLFSCHHNYPHINKPIFFPIYSGLLGVEQIIIIIIPLFLQGIYKYVPEINHISRECSVAAIL